MINVTTKYNKDLIISEVSMDNMDTIRDNITQQVIKLQDEGIRKALIKLGWTPPKDA